MYYTEDFGCEPRLPVPHKAQEFRTLEDIKTAYEDFCADCDRWGQTPAPAFIYIGKPSGKESQYGYPDYPEHLITRDDSGIITIKDV